ncbi:MAG: VCBS repeat-containing protein [Fuerstiella sp.]|nr:VCBS repeat-containing protein [Fuerstiella sp.]MCH2211786.1 VCBS repeat-containing protein [Fuerstiella sp.]
MHRLLQLMTAALVCSATALCTADEDENWIRIQLDARFRSEGAAAADFNNDGAIDVVAGDVWYQAPKYNTPDHLDASKWILREVREPGEFVAGKGYSNSFCNFTYDVNGDGWNDVILIGFPGEPFHWYRNPGHSGSDWIEHQIWTSACNESPEFEDLDSDGVPELVLGSQPEAQMGFVRLPGSAAASETQVFHPISTPSAMPQEAGNRGSDNGSFRYSHGLGVTDVDMDGHKDVIVRSGWWKSPGNTNEPALWKFHPIRISTPEGEQPLPDSGNIYAGDFDLDGDADLILSSAHKYGVWWAENPGDGALWQLHTIDDSYSQTHAMEEVDINGDGQLDYVTGKRFYAHNGGDPGSKEAVVMYWYEFKAEKHRAPKFLAHEIVAGRDTGVGTQFMIRDMNADDRPDIILSNKKGVNVLLQKR